MTFPRRLVNAISSRGANGTLGLYDVPSRWLRRTVLLTLVGQCVGCSSSKHELAPVSGRVTLNGEPLAGASVAFQPRSQGDISDTGPTSIGTTDEQGRFSLRVNTDDRQGAVVGEHIVWISTSRTSNPADDAERPRERVPVKYQDGSLRFTVPSGGTDSADFDL